MIRWACTCGRSLKADSSRAGRASHCPACGTALVVPYDTNAVAGIEPAPVRKSREEDSSDYALAETAPAAWVPSAPPHVDQKYDRPLIFRKRNSVEILGDPLVGVKFVFVLSGFQALLSALGVALYPHVLDEGIAWPAGLGLAALWMAVMGITIGYGCNFLDSVLEYSVKGGEGTIDVPDREPGPALTSLARWALCFASGPAILICGAIRYWIHCGTVDLIDGLILGELTASAIGYAMLGLLVLSCRPDAAFASPRLVLAAFRRLGQSALFAALGATAVGFLHVGLGALAVSLLHDEWLPGVVLLWIGWFSAWHCGAYLLWTLGFRHHNSRKAGARRNDCPTAA